MNINELKLKASLKQVAFDSCDMHIWGDYYHSKIDSKSDSVACVRCGIRMQVDEALKSGQMLMSNVVNG